MKKTPWFWVSGVAAFLVCVLPACGGDDETGGGGSATVAGATGAGGGTAAVHGCTTADAATDKTGEIPVVINMWSVPHTNCIRVKAGTDVEWLGNFSAHPLLGGVSPDEDSGSPVASATADMAPGGEDRMIVSFPTAGSWGSRSSTATRSSPRTSYSG